MKKYSINDAVMNEESKKMERKIVQSALRKANKMSAHAAKPTYFGAAALIAGLLCALSLLSNYASSQLNISFETFNLLNNATALLYCVLTQAALALGVWGLTRKNDSKPLAWTGIVLAVIPFLFVFGKFLVSMSG